MALIDELRKNPTYAGFSDDEIADGLKTLKPEYADFSIDEVKAVISEPGSEAFLPSLFSTPGEAPPEATWGERIADVGIDVAKATVGAGQALAGVAGLATGGAATRGLRELGYDPEYTQQFLSERYSPARKAEEREIAGAEGFTDTAGALVTNPAALTGRVIESAPLMLGALGAARAVGLRAYTSAYQTALQRGMAPADAAKAAADASARASTITAAATEGGETAGMTFEDLDRQGVELGRAYVAALGTGATTAAIGGVAGTVGRRIGLGDVEAGVGASGSLPVRALKGAAQEGAIEEMPQSATEQMWQNYARERDLMEGVPEAAATGLVVGGAAGAGFGAMRRPGAKQPAAGDQRDTKQPDMGEVDAATPVAQPAAAAQVTPEQAAQETAAALEAEDYFDPDEYPADFDVYGRTMYDLADDLEDIEPGLADDIIGRGIAAGLTEHDIITEIQGALRERTPFATRATRAGARTPAQEPSRRPTTAPQGRPQPAGATQQEVAPPAKPPAAPGPAAFTPTHELPDGTPVIATDEPNVWVDAEGNEYEDNYASPIETARGDHDAGLASGMGAAQPAPRGEDAQAAGAAAQAAPGRGPVPSEQAGEGASVAAGRFPITQKPKGSITVQGEPDAILAALQAAGVTHKGIKDKNGIRFSKAHADVVRRALSEAPPARQGDRRQHDVPVPEDRRQGERRKDTATRKRLDDMTPEEMRAEIEALRAERLTNRKSGLPNMDAYDQDADLGWAHAGAADMDGMGFYNEVFGHIPTDELIRAVGQVLARHANDRVRFYHFNGDEFAARAASREDLDAAFAAAQAELDRMEVTITGHVPNGPQVKVKIAGIGITYGLGQSYEEADADASARKETRAASGERAQKGTNTGRVEVLGEGEQGGIRLGQRGESKEVTVARLKGEHQEPAPAQAGVPVSGADVDAAAAEAATHPENDRPEPTDAQKEAGNYRKGHVTLHGLDISIENPRGSERSGIDPGGQRWSITMEHHYGYIRGTVGRDKDHLDVFLGPDPERAELPVFIIDQVNPETGRFDEHKILMGFPDEQAAREGYLANYEDNWDGLGGITQMSLEEFKTWLREGDTTKRLTKRNEDTSAPEQTAMDRLRTDKAFRAALKAFDAHIESPAAHKFAEGWEDANAGKTPAQRYLEPVEVFGGFDPINAYVSGYASAREGRPVKVSASEVAKTIERLGRQPSAQEDDAIGRAWDAMTRDERIAAAMRAGWYTAKGKPNFVAQRLSKQKWADINENTQRILREKGGIQAGTTTPTGPTTTTPGERVNGAVERAAAERLEQLWEQRPAVSRATPEGAAYGAIRSVFEELRKPRTVISVEAVLEQASQRLMRKYPDASDVVDEVIESLKAGERADTDVTDLNAMFGELLEEEVQARKKAQAPRERKPAAEQKPATERKPRTAGEHAKEAARETAKGLDAALDGLAALFGSKGRLGSGPVFDEETYAKAKPLFQEAIKHFTDAADNVREAMRLVIRALLDRFQDPDMVKRMQPYVVRFIEDVQTGKPVEEDTDAQPDTERPDRRAPRSEGALGQRGLDFDRPAQADLEGLAGDAAEDDGAPGRKGRRGAGDRVPGEDVGGRGTLPEGRDAADRREGAGREGAPDDGARGRERGRPNYHITDAERLIGGSPKVRFARNRKAIEALEAITAEGREPTQDELDAMAGYIGWGSFGQELFKGTFDRTIPKDGWQEESDWIKDHLGREAWESAQASIINAHYTDPITVGAMWDMVRQLGFKGGRVLEPSMGVGNFFGLMPRDLMERSQLAGIELDKTTGAMAKLLYPEANIQIKGYETSKTADNFYDLVIGNWPFAKETPFVDRRYMNLNPSLHDYFFLKALDQVRPGGLVVGITSAGTMDKQSARVRAALAEKAELVGAFRLPSGAFEKYAGTSVVTDIIILQKREKPIKDVKGEGWISTTEVDTPAGETVKVNEYFANNLDKVLGTLNFGSGSTYGRPAMIVDRPPDLEQRLKAVAGTLPKDVMTDRKQVDNTRYITNNTKDRQQSATIGPDGGIYVVKGEYLAPLEDVIRYKLKDPKKTAEREDQVRALIAMRRAYGTLIDTEREGGEDTESKRKALRAQYEAFVKSYGALNDSQGLTILRKIGDPFYPSLAALETPKGEPAAILSRPTVRTRRRMERPTIRDALVLARNENLDIDIERVAELAGVSVEQASRELIDAGQVFQTPAGNYEVRDVYLSGNVRRKLREAEAAKEAGMDMDANIEALQRVLPKDIPYFNIDAKMGATWIRPEHYRQFISELLGVSPDPNAIEVRWVVNRWKVKFHDRALNQRPEATTTWGYGAVRFDHLLSSAMGNVAVKVWTLDENKNRVVDEEASKEANEKANRLREEFSDWVWRDPARRIELERGYNEVMNAVATPDYDGSFLTFEGMALQRGDSPFNLRRHQVNAIWRGLANGRGIYGHEVGTGKTYTMGGIAVESRRYGMAKKPIIFAHNANSASVAREIGEMYPAAKILYVDNLDPSRIDVTMRQIANDDWDAVVVPHSLIDRFALSEETLSDLAREEIEALEMEAIEAAEEDGVELTVGMMDDEEKMKKVRSVTAKQLVHARNAILKRIASMAARSSRDNAVPFESMGIDMIIVDEAHEFKKPPIATRMMMRGLNKATSQQSLSLMLLTDYVKRINGGRGVHVFTGTPITNTINEIYNMQRYVMDDQMQRDGVRDWDGWFSAFADSTSDVELTATGEYEPVARLAAFVNVAELRRMAGQYMDIVFADDMPEFKPRQTASGKTIGDRLSETEQDELLNGRTERPVGRPYKKIVADTEEMSPQQAEIMAELQTRANIFRRASKKDRREMMLQGSKNVPIRVETDAANAGLDARLFDMNAADHPKSKVNRAVGNIARHFKEHPLSTQVVFVERGYTSEAVSRRKDPETGQVHVRKTPRFNLVEDMIEKLVAQGIPRHQIAVVDGSVSKEKRKLIADKMNTAEIRVVIGSTKTLGVGVNMQENLRAMHHLDAPWMPGDLEQRNGRGHRQGNKWNTVLEYRYITERIDGRRWQVLAIKDRFIKAFLKADESVRVIEGDAVSLEEDNDIGATLSEAAGDPRILLINKLKADVQRLENKERMHSQGVYDAKRKITQLEREIAETTQAVKELREVDSAFRAVVKGAFTATVGARTYTKTEEANEALARAVEKIEVGKTPFTTLGDVWGFTIKGRQTAPFSDPQYLIQKGDFELWIGKPTIESVRQTLYGIATRINAAEERIADAKGSIPRMEEAAKAPFGREEDLKKKRKLLADIEADLQANPVPAPAWLRNGAPVGSEVTIGKGSGARVGAVEGHRWTADGYLVTVTDKDGQTADVNYLDVTDLNGMPLYEARPFTPPVIATATSEQPAKGAMAVREEVALYSGYERAEDTVQGWERTQGGVQSPVGTGQGQLALFEPDGLPSEAAAARAQLADNFLVRYRQVPVAQIRVGFDTITTPEEAAHVVAQLRKAAQEEFLVIVADANGKILNVIRHTKGLKDSSSVDPTTVLAAIAATDDAAQVWFAHNHPSGVVAPSGADETITNRLIAGLDGTDIEFKGHVIVGTGKTATLLKNLGDRERIQIKPAARLRTLTITERAIRKQPPSERAVFDSPSASMEFIRSMESDSALLLLDNRHRLAGVVALTSAEMARLREGGRVRRILRAIDTTNASAAIIVSTNEKAAKNVGHFLGGLGGDMRILDGIIREPDGSLYSLANRGKTLSGGVFLARGTEAGRTIADEDVYRASEPAPYGMEAAKAEAITAKVALAWGSNAPNIHVFQSVRQAPTWITSQISERDYGLIKGVHERATGDVHLFADNLKDAREVHRILAHEAVGHTGMEEIVDRGEVVPGGWDAVERRMDFLVKSGNKQARALYDEVRRLGYDMDNRAVVTREMLAIAAERHVTDGLIGRLVRNLRAAVRNFLRKLGINSLLPDADIDAMVVRSLRYLRESGGRRAAIPAVLEHPQLGDIDVATGRGRTGLSRFAKTHPEITRNLEDLIAGARLVEETATRATLENGRSSFDLVKRDGRWVLMDARAIDLARSDETRAVYERRIDELFAGSKPERMGVRALDKSDVMEILGYGDMPIHVMESKIAEGRYNHGLTAEHWKKVPEWLENPVAVFDSDTVAGRLVFIAPEAVRGSPVVMIVEPETTLGRINVHLLVNAYDKTGRNAPVQRWIDDGLLRYLDEKQSPVVGTTTGLRLPRVVHQQRGSRKRVLTQRDLVKARSGPTASGLDFSRTASMDVLTEASTRAGEVLADLLKRPGVFGPLARTLQTQYHKATKSPQFRAVWERAHAMFMQSARAMSRPASLAPTLLPKFDASNFMDALKATVTGRGHVAPADIAAAAEALNAGTLYGGPSPLEGRVFKPEELRDGVEIEDGRTIKLTDTQIRLYIEARAAIDASLTETAAAEAWGVVKQYTEDARLRQLVAEQPHEAESLIMGLLKRAKEDAAAELRRMARNASDAVAEIIHDTGITPAEKLERLRALPARDNAERAAAQAAVVADLTDSQARVGAIFSKSRALQKAGYVPLMRFGRYRVSVVMEDEAGVEVEFVARYESAFEANRARRKLIRQYPAEDGYVVSEVEVMNDEKWRMFQGVNPETVMLFAEEAGIQADEVMQSWYKEAVSNRSALRRMVHRKGYAGFSEDLPRVLASFITSNGKRVGYAYHLGDMQRMINQDMPGDVQEEAQKLLETITNPERGMNIRGLMATWYLLGSAASSMVNMTQTLTMSLPWLAQYGKGGFAPGQASKAMVSAYKQIMGTVREDTRAALKRAEEEGVVDSNEVFHLYAEAMKPMISKLGSGRLAYRARAFMTVWGAPFAIAEKLNRKATFIAAYQMAMENGKTPGEAFQFAEKAVIETQGIYSAYNRPNWSRGPIGGAVMTFKQFSIAYVEMLARMAKAGPEGQKAALLALAILFFFAGASGLPGEDDLLDIIDTFAQVFFGKATVSRLEIRNALHEALGETMGDFVNYGISAFLPLDVSARLGLGNLLPGTAILKPSEPNKAAEAMEALGVAGSFGRSLMDGASALLQGEIGRAARVAAPKAVGDVLKGLEMATTGEARDMAGRKIIEASAVDAFVQAIGFQPATKGKIQRSTYEIRELIGYHRMVERGIVIDWARGVADGDRDKIAAARRRLEEWNANNHDLPIRINMKQIWMQVRQLKMEKTGRIEKTAPREIRRQVMEMTG